MKNEISELHNKVFLRAIQHPNFNISENEKIKKKDIVKAIKVAAYKELVLATENKTKNEKIIFLDDVINYYLIKCKGLDKVQPDKLGIKELVNLCLLKGAQSLIDEIAELEETDNQQDTSTTEINNTTECSTNIITLDSETEKKALEVFYFWSELDKRKYKNIFKEIKQQTYTEMVQKADFSDLKQHGCSQRVQYNVYVLSKILNNKEWGKIAAEKLGTTLANCQKRTLFAEYTELKKRFLQ